MIHLSSNPDEVGKSSSRHYVPRVWPSLTALVIVLPATAFFQGILFAIAALSGPNPDGGIEAILAFMLSEFGTWATVVTAQLTFAAIALFGARWSLTPFAARLGLRRPQLAPVDYVLLPIATLFVMRVGVLGANAMFGGPNAAQLGFAQRYASASPGWQVGLLLTMSLLPGICEELFARGFVQQRLLKRWSPTVAITVSSLAFAALHLDPVHVVSTIPIAFWLGYMAWRTNSTWPSILCHIVNNAVAMAVIPLDLGANPTAQLLAWPFFAASGFVFLASAFRLSQTKVRRRRVAAA